MTPISRTEWRRAFSFAVFVMLLTTIPYGLALANETHDWRFSGSLIGVEDGNSYLGKMRLGARGDWDFHLFYTPEPTDGAGLIFLPYIAAGQLVGRLVAPEALPSGLIIAFHSLRVLFGVALIAVMYAFIARFLRAEQARFHALVLATLGGGLGWLIVSVNSALLAPDIYIPEAFSFQVLYSLPHREIGRAAMLLGFICLMQSLPAALNTAPHGSAQRVKSSETTEPTTARVIAWRGSLLWAAAAGVCWIVLALCVPFYVSVVYVLLGVWGLAAWLLHRRFPRELFTRAVLAALLTLPLFAYFSLVFAGNPAFAAWSAQNRLPSPPVAEFLFAYVLLGGLGVWALPLVWRRARARIDYALLIGWLIAAPILVYLPINVQRRLGEGLIMPVAIVAALGLRVLLRRIFIDREAWRRWVGRALIGFASLSSVFILALGVSWTSIRPRPIFIESAQIDAFEWLRLNVERDSVILASWETGNQLPVYVDARPFIGLGPETINAEARADLMQRFYRDELDAAERQALFDEPCQSPYAVQNGKPCRIAFVVYGAAERAESLGESRATPLESAAWMAALTLVYDADGVQIYRVY